MLEIHLTLAVFMTNDTRKLLTIRWIWMTGQTLSPGSGVRTYKYREEKIIVIPEISPFSGRMAGQTIVTLISISLDSLVLGVHFALTVFMADQAGKLLTICRIWVAGHTLIPCPGMVTRENWKKLSVVISKFTFLSSRVTGKTIVTLIGIPLDSLVLGIHFALAMFMADQASEFLSICCVVMTDCAVLPFSGMFAGENRKKTGCHAL